MPDIEYNPDAEYRFQPGAPTVDTTWRGCTPNPDPTFVRKLKEYDKNLGIEFSREHGKFIITQKSKMSGRVPLFVIENPGREGYRQPDDRDLKDIFLSDMHNRSDSDAKARCQKGEDYMLSHMKTNERKIAEELRDHAKDNKHWLKSQFTKAANTGKGHLPYRQIAHKPQGKVF